ncbi:probable DNA-directed RNA polymerase III subunit RPC6 [Phymastichus coffea]|uniref:probable DNA-directed RNA polymerase III subunit RPC6 n=1 Tax=Phymastichus coffea TaxID=108790 RepID=UPI00273C07FE|nr:probable DNA-directed RNA polymerase III subunit RPC6 [Phymastichus coffea]
MTSTLENAGQVEELDSVAQKILTMAQTKPKGISDKDISAEIPNLPTTERAQAINKLLTLHLINLYKQGDTLFYKLKDPASARAAKGADNEEKVVYTIIEEAGNKGIWVKDIRFKSNLAPTQLTKILKSLDTKKLIKAVKSVAASRKKVYMLYNLEPDASVTGGAWYQDQDFEVEFVEVLNQQCYRFLEQRRDSPKKYVNGPMAERNASYASSNDVWMFINDLGISKVKLSVADLEMILDTLIYDGKVEKTITSDKRTLYRAIKPLLDPPGLIQSPCGVCPIRKNCCDFGDVTPTKCHYITDWLNV